MRSSLSRKLLENRYYLLLAFVVLIVYSPALFHVARSEQNLFLYETADLIGIKELVTETYSYARSRMFAAGDTILFRPFLYLCFAIQKWLFGFNFFYWQLVAVALHISVVWQLVRILNNFQPGFLAFLFGLSFAVLHVCQEMVIWHHMAPIMLQMSFILAAFFHLMRYIESGQTEAFRIKRIVIYLTIASLFHEYALICCVIFMFILTFDQFGRALRKRWNVPAAMLWPIVIFAVLSISDYWMRFGMPGAHSGHSFNLFKIIQYSAAMFLLALVLPFSPACLDISLKSWSQSRLAMDLSQLAHIKLLDGLLPVANYFVCLLLLSVLLFALFIKVRQKAGYQPQYLMQIVSLTAFLMSVGYVVMIVGSRLSERGFFYLNVNLFYLYPVILFSQIFIFNFLSSVSQSRKFVFILSAALLISSAINAYKNFELNVVLRKHSERLVEERGMDVNKYYLFQKYAARGLIYLEQKNNDLALKDFNRALEIHPGSADIFNARGIIYFREGLLSDAFADYSKALILNPSLYEGYSNRGIIYNQQGQYELAIKDFTQSLILNPAQATIYNDRGNAYARLGKFALALEDYSQAIKYDPHMTHAFYDRGFVYNQLKEYSKAVDDLNRTIELDKDYLQAYFQRGLAYAALGKFNEALADYDLLLTKIPYEALVQEKRDEFIKILNKK